MKDADGGFDQKVTQGFCVSWINARQKNNRREQE